MFIIIWDTYEIHPVNQLLSSSAIPVNAEGSTPGEYVYASGYCVPFPPSNEELLICAPVG
jgi:hypothetical protein